MKSKLRGKSSSKKRDKLQILNVSPRGMWILVNSAEYFIDFERYPGFGDASMSEIFEAEISGVGSGVYWPALDLDVELEALESPERYPLIAKIPVQKKKRQAA